MSSSPLEAFIRSQRDAEAFADLSPQDINQMSLAEFAKRTGRPTPAQAAVEAMAAEEPPLPDTAFTEVAETPPEPGLDPDSPEYFHQWRAQRVSHGMDKGIFDTVLSSSDEYRAAARAKSGRTGLVNSGVVEPPKLTGRQVKQDDRIDNRPARQRLSNPSNMWH